MLALRRRLPLFAQRRQRRDEARAALAGFDNVVEVAPRCCDERRCQHKNECMRGITPEMVYAAVSELLKETQTTQARQQPNSGA